MPTIPTFGDSHLEAICAALGDTDIGLTGSEIGELLARSQIEDPFPTITKRKRLFGALRRRQEQDRCGNAIAAFVMSAMEPVRFIGQGQKFKELQARLNQALAFVGYSLADDGKLHHISPAKTLFEAEQRAVRLRAELIRRAVHPDVLLFCRAELLQENYFHAVLEATKSVANKIREKANLTGDGAELVDRAFGIGRHGLPILAFNSLRTDTENQEHTGLMHLIKGLFGAFRNVTAHAPKIFWPVNEQDALDLLTMASLIHRRLDSAVRTAPVVNIR